MKDLVNEIYEVQYEDLDALELPFDKRVGLIVHRRGIKYEFLLNIKSNQDKLLVLSSEAFTKGKEYDRTKPLFTRWSWPFEQSTIHFNDPTLYLSDEILGGWGLGSTDQWYLMQIANILDKLFKKFSFRNDQVMIYGFSLGGFIALMLGTKLKNTVVIADSPQFDVTLWGYHWYLLKKYLFDDMDMKTIREKYNYKLDVIEYMKLENYIPNAYILMDCSTPYDFENIFTPFFNRLNELPYQGNSNSLKINAFGKMRGHKTLNKKELMKLIKDVALDMDNR